MPRKLGPIFVAAATKYQLGGQGPSILAAINDAETDFGRNLSTSSAGAIGWMQFMPATWASYGEDADHDGRTDPNDPWDAIFAAAHYLRANGAPGDWRTAIFAYAGLGGCDQAQRDPVRGCPPSRPVCALPGEPRPW